MRLISALIVLLLALTACAAPTPNGSTDAAQPVSASPAPPSDDGEYPRPKPPLPSRDPLPPASSGQDPVTVDYSCKTNADCTVKNVGNCCGYYPACVNVNSPTDPQGVQAECAKKGMMSVCGFPEISACTCTQGRCEASSANVVQ
jgi:hypothetical protein